MRFEGLDFSPLRESDIPCLTPVMKRAFDEDARLHFQAPEGGPTGYDDGSFLRKWGLNAGGEAWRVDLDGRPIGAVIVFVDKEKAEGFLGNIFIDSDIEGRGYGGIVWRFVEYTHPDVRAWSTETPAVSFRNHVFYVNKCGFHVTNIECGADKYEAQFHMRKEMPPRPAGLVIEPLAPAFSVCRLRDLSRAPVADAFCFVSKTDEEVSLVCATESVPSDAIAREDGWRAFRIQGTLDFSLTGILSRITDVLAREKIGIFAVSTYNTDYVLTKAERFDDALAALERAGYERA